MCGIDGGGGGVGDLDNTKYVTNYGLNDLELKACSIRVVQSKANKAQPSCLVVK